MQLKFQRAIAKSSTELWWQRFRPCCWYLSHLSLVFGYIMFLFYALVWESGNLVDLPTKKIGFYNFCLWNKEAGKLHCFLIGDLEKMGVSKLALVLSRVCVYTTPVLCLFGSTTVSQALWFKDKGGWKLARILLAVCVLILFFGLALFIFQTQKWVQVSDLSVAFVALAGAHILMLFHLIIIVLYLAQFEHTLAPKGLLPEKGIP
ncbi:transmembrane protein 140 [Hemicordylus capensis]|uniref:transmembrane protein 140 n=1 Tax=Hemicordylus capensis TaxID=884348 RepID=UPI0023028E0E|nr:transmembrane protein 140 [Hemicordylus capensis]XP_053108796.1 transmembrane protein 140 [Hemicordylus capensis]XP_053108797.1 transmembrane protein 140 [Hemicordylus capensis]